MKNCPSIRIRENIQQFFSSEYYESLRHAIKRDWPRYQREIIAR
jgi:hypothetical protein